MTPPPASAAAGATVLRPVPSTRRTPALASRASRDVGIRIAGRRISTSALLVVDVSLLCVFGLVMVGSASTVISIATYGTPWAIFIREAMWMAIGCLVLWLTIRFDYHKLRRISPVLLVVTFALLFVVLVPGLGVHVQGSTHLLRYDSTHGRLSVPVDVEGADLLVGERHIRVMAQREPEQLPWDKLGVDVVIESTGIFTTRAEAARHLGGSVKRVIISTASGTPTPPS